LSQDKSPALTSYEHWLNVYELYRSTQTSMIMEAFRFVDLHQSKLNSDIVQLNLSNKGDVMIVMILIR